MGAGLLVIQGGSATGKTTLASRLARDMQYGLVTKDQFKESLYDSLGSPTSRLDSTVYGKAAIAAMYAATRTLLESDRNIVLESAFQNAYADTDIRMLMEGLDVRVLQIFCFASIRTRLERERLRHQDSSRHAGHYVLTEHDFIAEGDTYTKLAIADTIEIDTDNFGDDSYRAVLGTIKTKLGDSE